MELLRSAGPADAQAQAQVARNGLNLGRPARGQEIGYGPTAAPIAIPVATLLHSGAPSAQSCAGRVMPALNLRSWQV